MKKLLTLLLTLTLAVSLVACTDKTGTSTKDPASISAEDAAKEWENFLVEYEALVDDYVEIAEKFEEDPSDTSIIEELSDIMEDLGVWEDKIKEVQEELEDASPEEVAKFTKEMARIEEKLQNAIAIFENAQ